jgi:hypothetical protein
MIFGMTYFIWDPAEKAHRLLHDAKLHKLIRTIPNDSILNSLVQDLDKSTSSTLLDLKMLPTWIKTQMNAH